MSRELLRNYPYNNWNRAPSDRWLSLCDFFEQYVPPPATLTFAPERKWELASAFQKAIRRADKPLALRLASAMYNLPDQHCYFLRRLCVIACEDVGLADDTLVLFVTACTKVFSPTKARSEIYNLFCFLAEEMCRLRNRSRVYCSCSIVGIELLRSHFPELTAKDEPLIAPILARMDKSAPWPHTRQEEWQKRNDWRSDAMLRFVGLRLPFELTSIPVTLPPHEMLFDLPSYAYDVHTRVGLRVLSRIVKGVAGAEAIKKFFQLYKLTNPQKALGEALFSVEGGRIEGELVYSELQDLENRVYAKQYGLSNEGWGELRYLTSEALRLGIVNRVRAEVLHECYGHAREAEQREGGCQQNLFGGRK